MNLAANARMLSRTRPIGAPPFLLMMILISNWAAPEDVMTRALHESVFGPMGVHPSFLPCSQQTSLLLSYRFQFSRGLPLPFSVLRDVY